MGEKLCKKEEEILGFISEKASLGESPSVREICSAFGYKSTSTAARHISSLVEKGYLIREDGKKRNLSLAVKPYVGKAVPIVGTVAAGQPILAFENREGYVTVNTKYPAESLFALRLKGESMIEIGMNNGDIVVARKASSAENGQIVVAMIDDEATVKEFSKKSDGIYLIPHNKLMEPIFVPCDEAENFEILGIVVALIRNYE